MNDSKMTPEEEHAFYSNPENLTPQGPAKRRRQRLTELVPVRFPPDVLEQVRAAAEADDRSVSSWVRQAVNQKLQTESY